MKHSRISTASLLDMVLDYSSGAKPKYQCPFFYYKFIYCNWKLITLQYCIGFVVFVLSWSAHIFLTVFILHSQYKWLMLILLGLSCGPYLHHHPFILQLTICGLGRISTNHDLLQVSKLTALIEQRAIKDKLHGYLI